MSTKQTTKQTTKRVIPTALLMQRDNLTKLAVASVHAIVESQTSVSILLRTCKSEADVIYAVSTMIDSVRPVLVEKNELHLEAQTLLKIKNSVTKFIARCRSGDDKLPPVWFDKARTIGYEPVSFKEVETRKTKSKADKEEEEIKRVEVFNKAVNTQAETLLTDKAILTKAQDAKVDKIVKAAKTGEELAQAKAKTAESLRLKSEADYCELAKEHNLKVQSLDNLKRDYEKALRQIAALEKALQMLQVERAAIDAIMAV